MSDKKKLIPTTEEEAQQAAVKHLMEEMQKNGVAVSSVKDGFVLAFNRQHMLKLLEQHKDNKELVIFVKTPTFGN